MIIQILHWEAALIQKVGAPGPLEELGRVDVSFDRQALSLTEHYVSIYGTRTQGRTRSWENSRLLYLDKTVAVFESETLPEGPDLPTEGNPYRTPARGLWETTRIYLFFQDICCPERLHKLGLAFPAQTKEA